MFAALLRKIRPFKAASTEVVQSNETLAGFVWRASGVHEFYAGLLAIAVALLNFAPIDLQRRIVDEAIASRDVKALLVLGVLYLAIVFIQGALKYALLVYQGWVGESAVKTARDQLAIVASERLRRMRRRADRRSTSSAGKSTTSAASSEQAYRSLWSI